MMDNYIDPIKIIIYGNYWDSYIYRNHLMLIDMESIVHSYEWDKNILKNIKDDDKMVIKCAFINSDYLYKVNERGFFEDPEFMNLIKTKFLRIRNVNIDFDVSNEKSSIKFELLPIDIGIYKNELFYIDSRGLFSRSINVKNKNIIGKSEIELWNKKIQSINIGPRGRILLSASSDGLYEFNRLDHFKDDLISIHDVDYDNGHIYKISNEHSTNSDWAFSTIVNNSYYNIPTIFQFYTGKKIEEFDENNKDITKHISSIELFNDINIDECVITSNNEKIYCIYKNRIEGYQYNLFEVNKNEEKIFNKLNNITFESKERICKSQVTEFGIVIETSKSLYVVEINGKITKLNNDNEEFVKWRVFPKSNCYANQIHVIYDDRIEIISFNNDCFYNGKEKVGFKHRFADEDGIAIKRNKFNNK